MAIIKKIYLKNAEGDNVTYDVGASAENVKFDNQNSVKDKIEDLDTDVSGLNNSATNLSNSVSGHDDASVVGTEGVHDIRYYNDKIQVYKNGSQVNASSQLTGEKGISISSDNKIGHSNNVTSGTIGSSSTTSGSSFEIPYANYDAQGHITSKGNRTHTVPIASTGTAGVAKVDGSSIIISNGVISASSSSLVAGTGLSKSGSTINHSNSITAGTIGSSSASSGVSFSIPYANYDAQGHITGRGNRTHTIPAATANSIGIVKPDNETVLIGSDGTLSLNLIELGATQTTGTDAQIMGIINGYYNDNYSLNDIKSIQSIGDVRNITIGAIATSGTVNGFTQSVGESHHQQTIGFEILGFDHDTLTTAINGKTKALITIQQKECLRHSGCSDTDGEHNTEHGYMNSIDTNVGGQKDCARRNQCNGGYYNALPTYIKNLIKPVNKLTSVGNQSSTINTTSDYCFLPSEIEIFGRVSYSKSGEGSQYAQFANSTSNRNKLPCWVSSVASDIWQERSPYGSSSIGFCRVDGLGGAPSSNASDARGLAPAFAL